MRFWFCPNPREFKQANAVSFWSQPNHELFWFPIDPFPTYSISALSWLAVSMLRQVEELKTELKLSSIVSVSRALPRCLFLCPYWPSGKPGYPQDIHSYVSFSNKSDV